MADGRQTALVIGATGGIGSEIASALLARNWRVKALTRTARQARGALEWVTGDAMDAGAVASAAKGADVIVNAANPRNYKNWRGLALPMLANAVAAAKAERALIVLPGNIYNYGPDAWPVIREDSPQHPVSKKGGVRVEMETMLDKATAEGARALIVRAPDVFGNLSASSYFNTLLVKPGRPLTRVVDPGEPGVGHAWAYTPDLGEATAALIAMRDRLAPFETVNFAGHWFASNRAFADAIRKAAGKPDLPIRGFPWWLVHTLSPIVPLFGELAEMRYLWREPLQLDNAKLVSLIGNEPRTPIDEALRNALAAIGAMPEN